MDDRDRIEQLEARVASIEARLNSQGSLMEKISEGLKANGLLMQKIDRKLEKLADDFDRADSWRDGDGESDNE